MAETVTINVPREARHRLAKAAAARGISVAALIEEFAAREHVHQIHNDERRALAARA